MSEFAIPRAPHPALDREALLAALVLAPATYSRNRFFEMYTNHEVRRIRRRATQLRSVIAHLVRPGITQRREEPGEDDLVRLTYEVPNIGLRRTIALAPIELSLLRFAIARFQEPSAALAPDDPDRRRIEDALARLAPVSAAVSPPPPPV